jgi:translation initiation factor 5A
MSIKQEDVNDLKVGRYVMVDGVPCKITAITKSKPGKHGGAKAKIDAVGVFDNQKRSIIKPTEKRTGQVLTVVGQNVQLMDMENYETFDLPMPEDEELKPGITAGGQVIYMQVMGKRKIIQLKGGE